MWKTYVFILIQPFVLVIPLTIATRIDNAKARSSAVFVEGKSRATTLAIGIY